jgi:pantetheine-phosphate adenylyltransferase
MESGLTSNICIGGTFSPLHKGHLMLLKEAFRRGKRVSVGLTSDKMARRSRKRNVHSYERRLRDLTELLEDLSEEFNVKYTVREINDRFGFAVKEEIDSIVVSMETEHTVDDIDQERLKMDLKPLRRFVVGMVLDDGGERISSTRVARGEIDRKGRTISPYGNGGPASKVCIHLGSKNQDKVNGAISAFRRYWPEVQVFKYDVSRGTQSIGRDDPLGGAIRRAEDVRKRIEPSEIGLEDHMVGIESGLMEVNGTWFFIHCCFISFERGKGSGLSSGLEIPPNMLESIMVYRGSTWEVKDIMGKRTSLIENLSGGSIPRDVMIEQSCKMALLSLFNSLKKEEVQ